MRLYIGSWVYLGIASQLRLKFNKPSIISIETIVGLRILKKKVLG